MQVSVADGEVEVSVLIVGEEVAGVQSAGFGVVVDVPLEIRGGCGLPAQAGNDRGVVSRALEKGDAAQVEGCVEYIAGSRRHCVAKIRIEEVLVADGPAQPVGRATAASLVRAQGIVSGTGMCMQMTQEEALSEKVVELPGVAGDVNTVELEH